MSCMLTVQRVETLCVFQHVCLRLPGVIVAVILSDKLVSGVAILTWLRMTETESLLWF